MNSNVYFPNNLFEHEIANSDKLLIYEEYEEDTKSEEIYKIIFNEFICPIVIEYITKVEVDYFKEKNCEFLFFASLFLISSNHKKDQQAEKFNWIFRESDYLILDKLFNENSCYYFNSERKEIFSKLFLNEENTYNFYNDYHHFIKKKLRNNFFEKMMKMAKFTSLLIKYVNGISILNMIKCFIKDIISNYEDSFKSFVNILFNKLLGNSQIENYQSNMIKHLVKILTDINKNTETKTIVFTKYRVTAYYINQILNKSPETMSTIILGYNNNNFMSFSEKDLNTNFEKFKNTSCNILISTDVAEEGIDIQQCNKIIHLDQLETIKSFIQKNGRGRIAESEIHLFVTKCERQNYEKLLKNIKNGVLIIKDIINKKYPN